MKHSKFLTCHGTPLEEGFMDLCIILNCAPLPGGTAWGDEEEDGMVYPSPFSSTSYKDWMKEERISSAKSHWNHWSNLVQNCRNNGLRNGLDQIIPELQSTLSLLSGEGVSSTTWQSLLLYDILYKNPAPRDISYKIRGYMGEDVDMTLLNIINGDAGQVVLKLFDLGGRSGAVLPTSLNALVLDLLWREGKVEDGDLLEDLLLSAGKF